jgi:hypothetical protein
MADRDWDKELAKVDKQLASLSDDALLGPPPATTGGKRDPTAASRDARSEKASRSPSEPRATTSFGVYARLTLSVLVGAAIVIWPYPVRCGIGLAGYLGAVAVVTASGIWSSVWTWRHRASKAHTLSLLLILWGLVLGSLEVLPRIGYAKPDLRHPAMWVCP